MVKELFQNNHNSPANSKSSLICCFCQNKTEMENGIASLEKLPKNLHVESLLKLMEEERSPNTPKPMDSRCAKCQTISTEEEHVCQHCMQVKTIYSNHIFKHSVLSLFLYYIANKVKNLNI